jgi:polyphenol oxidase
MNHHPLPLIRSSLLAQFPNIEFGMSTRQGESHDAPFAFNLGYDLGDEDERVTGNITRFANAIGIEPSDLAFMQQVHGDTIRDIADAGIYEATDAMVTTQPRIGLTVRTADCVPVILYCPEVQVIGVAHAGWRGTAAHISRKLVEHLTTSYNVDPVHIFSYIGPAAGKDSYEVGADVAALFPSSFVDTSNERPRIDLKGLNAHQLLEAGVKHEHIETDPLCTIRDRAVCHSWRRDGPRSGRMLATLYLKDTIE